MNKTSLQPNGGQKLRPVTNNLRHLFILVGIALIAASALAQTSQQKKPCLIVSTEVVPQ